MAKVANLHVSTAHEIVASEEDETKLEAVRILLKGMSRGERERIFSELRTMVRPIEVPRADDVLGTVIQFLPKRADWTAPELKVAVEAKGVEASVKDVHNALGYLARKGEIRRVGYGRYAINGIIVETTDDLGGPNLRHDDEYRTDRDQEAPERDLSRD